MVVLGTGFLFECLITMLDLAERKTTFLLRFIPALHDYIFYILIIIMYNLYALVLVETYEKCRNIQEMYDMRQFQAVIVRLVLV